MKNLSFPVALLYCILQSIIVSLVRLPIIFIGFFAVAIGIFFRVDDVSKSDGRPIKNLPKWLWIFGNDHDGLLGDKRDWWEENAPFGLGADHFISQWVWTAFRNPANNLRHISFFSAPVHEPDIDGGYFGDPDIGRKGNGYCLTWAQREGNKLPWTGFICRFPYWKGSKYAFYMRFGYKFWYEDINVGNASAYGTTFRLSPLMKAAED